MSDRLRQALRVAPAFLLVAICIAAASRDSGIPALLRLEADRREAEHRIALASRSVADLEARATALRDSEFELERAIRNDLRLAKPGEIVVIVPGRERGELALP